MTKSKPTVVTQVEDEHILLKQEMGALSMFAMQEKMNSDFGEWRLQFVWQLRDFKNRLLKHFDLEEEGGFMRDVLKISPQSLRKVDDLKAEHEKIAADLDRLTATMRAMRERNSEVLQSVRSDLNEIIVALRKHESEENQLIQRAYYREYGGPA
ncbi:MAG: hemerythrin domain-containing protein [Candidatus Zixiibacteriota bacterium]